MGAECGTPYLGFDSRLRPEIVGRLPAGDETVSGFEVWRGLPVVVLGDRVIAFRERKLVQLASGVNARALAVDGDGNLWMQSGSRVSGLSDAGFRDMSAPVAGRLANSGDARFVEVVEGRGLVRVLGTGGRYYDLATLGQSPTALYWGAAGLAFVTKDSLISWRHGSPEMAVVLRDTGLSSTRDLCMSTNGRVFLALKSSVVLVAETGAGLVVAGFPARVRLHGGNLFVLDEKSGLIWRVGGLEKLSGRQSDSAHARALLAGGARPGDWKFGEASRILGCTVALESAGLGPVPILAGARPQVDGRSDAGSDEWQRLVARSAKSLPGPTPPSSNGSPGVADSLERLGLTVAPGWLSGAGDGLVVRSVQDGSAASTAGLKPGERITGAGGNPVTSKEDLLGAIEKARGSGKLTLRLETTAGARTISIAVH